ncbi:MAG: protein kinase [Myxococcales bacterium]|nr:protein kinase [Myxococcales bacterium]
MSAPTPATDTATSPAIESGTLLGGRFRVERPSHEDALGATLLARDEKTRKPIAIRVLSQRIVTDTDTFDAIRGEVKAAAKLKHRSLMGTYGVGTHGGNHPFIATEWVNGEPLSELVVKRRQAQQPLSVRGAYNVIAHVCKALGTVHDSSCHGALRPSVVWVSRSGRVKIGDLGVGLALVGSGKWALLPAEEQAYLAPEVKADGTPDARSDVFGIGALLYVMLTGRSPMDDFVPPSQAHPDATEELDAILMQCLAVDPTQRYQDVKDIAAALLPLVASTPEPEGNEFGVDLELDIDIAMSIAPPAPEPAHDAPAAVVFQGASAPAGAIPAVAPAPMAAPNPLAAPAPMAAEPAAPRKRLEDELGELTDRLTQNDAPRWMAVKGGLDHGPFTARELIKLIVEGEVLSEHGLLNMDSNERKPLAEWEEFQDFVQQYKLRREEAEHAAALEASTKIERRGNVAKFAILGGSLALILFAGGGYLLSRQAAEKREAGDDVDLAAMFESGQVQIQGTAGILKAPTGGKRRKGGARSGGGGGGFTSYEDAMNTAMELGDATKGGGERQLRSSDVAGVMNRKLNTLFGCVSQELRRGGRLGNVRIDLAILGSGKVMGASVNTGSGAFKKCIAAKVRSIQFPSFPAPRMGARYSFDVD